MNEQHDRRYGRREFLERAAATGAVAGLSILAASRGYAAEGTGSLSVGQGVVDTTPPTGIELGGFHRPPGQERMLTGIRQPTAARALVLRLGEVQAALVSLDILGVSPAFTKKVGERVAATSGIPAQHLRICTTHTHSMPCFRYLRQWGATPEKYMDEVIDKVAKAVALAKEDIAPAAMYVGRSQADGGNFNRTTGAWKTDKDFTKDSTDAERWLDTTVHVLRFERSGKPDALWYHFSAHPVCYTDGLAGPDWVGITAELVQAKHKVAPAFLQGHAGDVNPGNGKLWLGDPKQTGEAVAAAIEQAIAASAQAKVPELRLANDQFHTPLDIELLKSQMEHYRTEPDKCTTGEWVDVGFAKAWYEGAQKYDLARTTHASAMSAMRLGSVGLVFHPTELYSYYGLAIRRDSPLEHTLVVGYTDDIIGYLADPNAYKAGEYAATTVPRILDLPPFTPTAARQLTTDAVTLLKKVAG